MEEAKLFLEKFDTTQLGDNAIDRASVVGMIASNFNRGDCFMIDKDNNSGVLHITPSFDLKVIKEKTNEEEV